MGYVFVIVLIFKCIHKLLVMEKEVFLEIQNMKIGGITIIILLIPMIILDR